MPLITRHELEEAKIDAEILEKVVNDPAIEPNPGYDFGTVNTRFGDNVKNVRKVLEEVRALAGNIIQFNIDQTEIFKNEAEAARDMAVIMAQASAFNAIYDTKSNADNDLNNRINGDVILVIRDETLGLKTTVYLVENSNYTFIRYFSIGKTVYLDPSNGNDSNTGLESNSALKTANHAISKLTTGDELL